MKLTLHATTYDWVFLPIAGSTFTDSGSGSVHAAPPGNHAPDLPTVNAPTNGASGVALSPTLSVGVSDPDSDSLTVTFFGRPFASGNFTQIAQNTGVASGTNDHDDLGEPRCRPDVRVVRDRQGRRPTPDRSDLDVPHHRRAPTRCSSALATSPSCPITDDTATRQHRRRASTATSGQPATTSTTTALPREFTNCYAPRLGTGVKSRTRPVPGNHDWGLGNTNNLDGYNGYFGAAATDAGGKSYYSYDIPSATGTSSTSTANAQAYGGCAAGSAQELWLKADLAANSTKNVIADLAQAALQLGLHAISTELQPLLGRHLRGRRRHPARRPRPHLRADRADGVGATLASPPVADPTYGIRQFTVGTGGEGQQRLHTPLPTSEVRTATRSAC